MSVANTRNLRENNIPKKMFWVCLKKFLKVSSNCCKWGSHKGGCNNRNSGRNNRNRGRNNCNRGRNNCTMVAADLQRSQPTVTMVTTSLNF